MSKTETPAIFEKASVKLVTSTGAHVQLTGLTEDEILEIGKLIATILHRDSAGERR